MCFHKAVEGAIMKLSCVGNGYSLEGLWGKEVAEAEVHPVKNFTGEVMCSVCAVSLEDDSEPEKLRRLFYIS